MAEPERKEKAVSIKKQEEQIRAFLRQYLHHEVEPAHEAFPEFLAILSTQPKWHEKLGTIKSFRVTRSRLNKAVLLQAKVGKCNKWLTLSWRKGSTKKRQEGDPLQSAFRQAVRRQISQWRQEHWFAKECEECKARTNLQVDHKDPLFVDMTGNFLRTQEADTVPTEFDFNRGSCGKKFKRSDTKFTRKWQNYHRRHASLQWLCKTCNLSKKRKISQ